MKDKIFKTIIWKENRIFFKSCLPICILYFGMELYFFLNNISNVIFINEDLLRGQLFTFTCVNIALVGSLVSSFNMGFDLKAKILPVLLGMTKKKEIIWLAKTIYSFIVGVAFSFIGIVAMIFTYSKKGNLNNIMSDFEYVLAGVIVGLAFITINMFFLWIIKYEVIMTLMSLILPVVLIVAIVNLLDYLQKLSFIVIGITTIISIALIFGSVLLIKKIPNSLFVDKV